MEQCVLPECIWASEMNLPLRWIQAGSAVSGQCEQRLGVGPFLVLKQGRAPAWGSGAGGKSRDLRGRDEAWMWLERQAVP